MSEPLVVLFEDAHCLAVVKPAGLLTQGTSSGEPTLEDAVRRHLSPAAPDAPYVGTVHRLDRPVSGVVVWAKTPKAARRLAEQFARRDVVKEYRAIVEWPGPGPDPPPGRDEVWDDWLADPGAGGVARPVDPEAPGARRAVTRVRILGPAGPPRSSPSRVGLVLWPETGRTHQLRAQAAARGRPIAGDVAYGSSLGFLRGIALHARALTIRHPILRTPMTWEAPFPDAWGA
jgi:23S rRNA pseudouridine1911/1915/1917 synthase